jgi:hypothetical protein
VALQPAQRLNSSNQAIEAYVRTPATAFPDFGVDEMVLVVVCVVLVIF